MRMSGIGRIAATLGMAALLAAARSEGGLIAVIARAKHPRAAELFVRMSGR